MKAAGSIGANSPLRLRLLVMTCVTRRADLAVAGVPADEIRDRDRQRLRHCPG